MNKKRLSDIFQKAFFVCFYFTQYVISTEGRNHTRNSTKIDDFNCGVSSVISPFGRNDILYDYLFCNLFSFFFLLSSFFFLLSSFFFLLSSFFFLLSSFFFNLSSILYSLFLCVRDRSWLPK